MKAYKLKFACGSSGYKELLKQGHPLPSLRTLSRKIEDLKFDSGICEEMFVFLRIQVETFKNEIDKYCLLVLDEISITPTDNVLDRSTNKLLGQVTLPEHDGQADQALVIMLAGFGSRWKQIVGYFFTNKNGIVHKPIVEQIIRKSENIGLRVHCVTSNMGAGNQGMCRSFGIVAGKYSKVSNYCKHLRDEIRKL